jgi:membrane protease YdiL (CAAX protease family)
VDDLTRYVLGAFAATAGLSLIILLGLFFFVPALRKRWLPIKRLRPGVWTEREVLLAFFIELGLPSLVLAVLMQAAFFGVLIGPPPESGASANERTSYGVQTLAIASPIILTITLGCLFLLMFLSGGSRPHQYGLTWARWPANLGLGLAAFVVTWPVIMGLQELVTLVDKPTFDPYEQLVKRGLPAWEWPLLAFQLCIAAPLLEETLFRGILQGWLRRASLAGHVALPVVALSVAGVYSMQPEQSGEDYAISYGPTVFALALAIGYVYWLYRLVRRFDLGADELWAWRPTDELDYLRRQQWADANANLAIYGSAMLFAIAHARAWPAPLPLFPMGLALGWLSRRTQSLIGPIVFHAMFNLTSFIALCCLASSR